jgi:hypothetical protein
MADDATTTIIHREPVAIEIVETGSGPAYRY